MGEKQREELDDNILVKRSAAECLCLQTFLTSVLKTNGQGSTRATQQSNKRLATSPRFSKEPPAAVLHTILIQWSYTCFSSSKRHWQEKGSEFTSLKSSMAVQ